MSEPVYIGQTPHKFLCVGCGEELDGFSGETRQGPQTGDATICAYCEIWMIMVSPTEARIPTEQEKEQLKLDPLFMKFVRIVKDLRVKRRSPR